jgi:hypothetical protein
LCGRRIKIDFGRVSGYYNCCIHLDGAQLTNLTEIHDGSWMCDKKD